MRAEPERIYAVIVPAEGEDFMPVTVVTVDVMGILAGRTSPSRKGRPPTASARRRAQHMACEVVRLEGHVPLTKQAVLLVAEAFDVTDRTVWRALEEHGDYARRYSSDYVNVLRNAGKLAK